jgi:hypothetical protein
MCHIVPAFSYWEDTKTLLLADVADPQVIVQTGVGLGSVLAVTCSWQRNRSILWAILAGILSWFYVIYFALTRRPEELK